MKGTEMKRIQLSLFLAVFFLTAVIFLTAALPPVSAQQKSGNTRGIRVVGVKTREGKRMDLYQGSHALLVGVSDYTAGWPDLESIPGELDLLEAALLRQGFSVTRVRNPNSRQMKRAFADFIDKYGYDRENRLLFFFSGHGYTRTTDGRRKGYLVPADAPNPLKDLLGFNRRALTMSQVQTWAREIEAKHALFLFDSCFSGAIFKTRALPVPRHISDKTAKPVRQFITAGSAGEEVPAESVFLPSFIRAIEGEGDLNRDGYVTGTELGQFLHQRVLSYDLGQTPQYGKIRDPALDQGDFVFPLQTAVSSPMMANVPKGPGKSGFDLGAIQRAAAGEKASRGAWAAKLREMRDAYRQVAAIDKDKLSPGLKARAWGQFLGAFTGNNPYTNEDEELRAKANKRLAWWRGEKWRLARLAQRPKRLQIPPGQSERVFSPKPHLTCNQEKLVRSTKWDTKALVKIVNNSSEILKAYWLNYKGERELYATVRPGKSFSLNTFLTHPWLIANVANRCAAIYLPTTKPLVITVRKMDRLARDPNPTALTPLSGSRTWRDPVTGMQFVKVPGGSFEMGCHSNAGDCTDNEKPVRTVRLDGFWMGKYEVTQGQWKRIMGSNPSNFKRGDNYPVEKVSWNDVQQFLRRLNSQSSTRFRLPSEAQWEFACRSGGKSVTFGTGNDRVSSGNTNFKNNNRGTTSVGRYQANGLGLHDMSGNLWEWVQDKFTGYGNVGTNNPIFERFDSDPVIRGGGWSGRTRALRCSTRTLYGSSDRLTFIGFRLVRVL